MKTPREVAEELHLQLFGKDAWAGRNALLNIIEAAITAERRALLAEDEATIEAVASAIHSVPGHGDVSVGFPKDQARAALAALRRLRGVE